MYITAVPAAAAAAAAAVTAAAGSSGRKEEGTNPNLTSLVHAHAPLHVLHEDAPACIELLRAMHSTICLLPSKLHCTALLLPSAAAVHLQLLNTSGIAHLCFNLSNCW